jgi:hypothetical protein
MSTAPVLERPEITILPNLAQQASGLKEILRTSYKEYSDILSILEEDNDRYSKISEELKKLSLSRGYNEINWEEGIAVKDRWEIEEQLLKRGDIAIPTNERVLEYCKNVLLIIDRYHQIFEKLSANKKLTTKELEILYNREEIKKQLDNSQLNTQKPLSIVGGQHLAEQIESFCNNFLRIKETAA